ncbi:hypothetical protein D1820_04565 [Phaeobacter sp. LSS9]|uniref:hypothetical protein n=1 Tax=unclassified Phaeobacter TaxID=2621772 RepID=UPI000E55303A|nr:hypothetical protein [Phaeobacter sp. LSS9]AXT34305.1 hypothetical protein D1820_04565 [Phaeobacter sp. LSS9]
MEQIEELQGRILAAMDRIGSGAAALQANARASAEAHVQAQAEAQSKTDAAQNDLSRALEEEKLANAQLEERLKVLRAKLEEAEANAAPAPGADIGELAALQSEVELLRNELSNTSEKDALKAEVARLKQEMEVQGNEAATARETLQDELDEAQASLARLQEELAEQPDDLGAAVDTAALEAEAEALRRQLEAAQSDAARATAALAERPAGPSAEDIAQQNETLLRLDATLQELRQSNDQLRASNAALREANAAGVGDAALINSALQADIDALTAARASDQAEVNAVLAKLEPLLGAEQTVAAAVETPVADTAVMSVAPPPLTAQPMPEGEEI